MTLSRAAGKDVAGCLRTGGWNDRHGRGECQAAVRSRECQHGRITPSADGLERGVCERRHGLAFEAVPAHHGGALQSCSSKPCRQRERFDMVLGEVGGRTATQKFTIYALIYVRGCGIIFI